MKVRLLLRNCRSKIIEQGMWQREDYGHQDVMFTFEILVVRNVDIEMGG